MNPRAMDSKPFHSIANNSEGSLDGGNNALQVLAQSSVPSPNSYKAKSDPVAGLTAVSRTKPLLSGSLHPSLGANHRQTHKTTAATAQCHEENCIWIREQRGLRGLCGQGNQRLEA